MRLVQEDPTGAGFYIAPQSYVSHLIETYGDKLQFTKNEEGSILTSSIKFADDATHLQYEADPVVLHYRRLRDEYNAANGIITRKHFD
jgi:hypothetical protein